MMMYMKIPFKFQPDFNMTDMSLTMKDSRIHLMSAIPMQRIQTCWT